MAMDKNMYGNSPAMSVNPIEEPDIQNMAIKNNVGMNIANGNTSVSNRNALGRKYMKNNAVNLAANEKLDDPFKGMISRQINPMV